MPKQTPITQRCKKLRSPIKINYDGSADPDEKTNQRETLIRLGREYINRPNMIILDDSELSQCVFNRTQDFAVPTMVCEISSKTKLRQAAIKRRRGLSNVQLRECDVMMMLKYPHLYNSLFLDYLNAYWGNKKMGIFPNQAIELALQNAVQSRIVLGFVVAGMGVKGYNQAIVTKEFRAMVERQGFRIIKYIEQRMYGKRMMLARFCVLEKI